MTHDDIDNLPAGAEMDVLIAVEVMNWAPYPDDESAVTYPSFIFLHGVIYVCDDPRPGEITRSNWSPSTDIGVAMREVVPKMKGPCINYAEPGSSLVPDDRWKDGQWHAGFMVGGYRERVNAWAGTPALAICRAALKAVGYKP